MTPSEVTNILRQFNTIVTGPCAGERRQMNTEAMPAQGPVDVSVGQADEAANTEGPRGTHGCDCLDSDAMQCAAIRYGMDHYGEPCEGLCHQWGDDDECY